MAIREKMDVFEDLQQTLDGGGTGFFAAWESASKQTLEMRERVDAVAEGLTRQREALEGLLQQAGAKVELARAHWVQRASSADEAEERIAGLQAAAAELQARQDALQTALRGAEDRARAAEARVEELSVEQDSGAKRIAELERFSGQEAAASSAARERVQALEQELLAAGKEAVALRESLGAASTEQARISTEHDALQQELAVLRSAETELRAELELVNERVKASEAATATARQAAEDTAQELAAVRGELAEAAQQLQVERDRAEMLEAQMRDEQARGTKSLLATQLAEALQDADGLRQELRAVRRELDQHRRKLGLTAEDETQKIRDAAQRVRGGQKRAMGELLVDAGIISQDQVDQTMEEQKKKPQLQLGALLVEKRLATPEAVAQALACQWDAEFIRIDSSSIEPDAPSLISERLALMHLCIPVRATEDEMVLAMANPSNLVAIEDIERAANRKVDIVVATETEIRDAIAQHYAGTAGPV
jgi:chromosome segregation ATPase